MVISPCIQCLLKIRRLERREDIFDILEEKGFQINDIMDYTSAEEDGIFLKEQEVLF
jgi:hypothetical protein